MEIRMEEIVNEIIKDLGADKPIKDILLKSQIVASELNNNSFSEWISKHSIAFAAK